MIPVLAVAASKVILVIALIAWLAHKADQGRRRRAIQQEMRKVGFVGRQSFAQWFDDNSRHW